jgi:hypothetical protein
MAIDKTTHYTVHGVLAGAYARDISATKLLTHASQDESATSVCKRVREGNLCDMSEDGPVTCPVCLQRIASRGLTRKVCE